MEQIRKTVKSELCEIYRLVIGYLLVKLFEE